LKVDIPRFVLDSSVTLSWAFTDEQEPSAMRAAQLLESDAADAIVPVLWWYEIRNILIVGERRSRITPERTAIFLRQISDLPIEIAAAPEDGILLDLARETKLTVYDAAYLAVALQENLPIATLDTALRAAALSRGIPLLA
jgi:predicted nucleic acid-binding protein